MSLGPHTVTAYFVHFLLSWIEFIATYSNCHAGLDSRIYAFIQLFVAEFRNENIDYQ